MSLQERHPLPPPLESLGIAYVLHGITKALEGGGGSGGVVGGV